MRPALAAALAVSAPGSSGLRQRRDRLATLQTLLAFIKGASGPHQPALVIMAMVLFVADLVPLELQRRIVNEALPGGSARTIVLLALLYIAAAVSMGALKLGLNVYRSYVSESAVRRLRKTLLDDLGKLDPGDRAEVEGVEVSLVLAEVEPVGGFVGLSVSEPVLQGGIVAGTFGYMLYLNPLMAVLALAVFSPQAVFVPLMQEAINRRVVTRTGTLRRISGGIIVQRQYKPSRLQAARIDRVFRLNMGIFKLKFSMNFLMNLMHHSGVALTLGLGGYLVVHGATELGTVVAFAAGLKQLNDPWGGLVDWFRELRVTQTKYELIHQALDTFSRHMVSPNETLTPLLRGQEVVLDRMRCGTKARSEDADSRRCRRAHSRLDCEEPHDAVMQPTVRAECPDLLTASRCSRDLYAPPERTAPICAAYAPDACRRAARRPWT